MPIRDRFFAGTFVVLALCCTSLSAHATPPTWVTPLGGEIWTIGTSHNIYWADGGSGPVSLIIVPVSPAGTPLLVGYSFANGGYHPFSISTNFTPGVYRMDLLLSGDPTFYPSPEFTLVAGPECLSGCSLVSFGPPFTLETGDGKACGASAAEAYAAAEALAMAELESGCFDGYSIDPGSAIIEVTFIPNDIYPCAAGTSGIYQAEVTALGCCCPDPVSEDGMPWGTVKGLYR